MQSDLTTLPNGLRIISASRPGTESVSLGIWINTGSAREEEEINGLSHFLEHMVFKGTPTRTSFQIDAEIEDAGGQTNAYTSREITSFYAKMLKDDAELALDVLADIVLNASFPDEEVVKERDVVIQEIKQTIDTPDDIIFDYLQQQAYTGQPLGRPILGSIEKVSGFTADDLRKYRKRFYVAENICVCAVGNIEHEKFVDMVKKRFSNLPQHLDSEFPTQKYVGGYYAEQRDIKQAHVLIGFEGVSYHDDDYYPAAVLSAILGGGSTSRLFQEIREKRGLVYTVYSFINAHRSSGLMGIYAGTTRKELQELIPVVTAEINKIRTAPVLPEELKRAKVQFKAIMLMGLESSSTTSEIYARQMLVFGRIIPTEEMTAKIDAITAEDITKIANRIFASKPVYTLVGDIDGHPDYDELRRLLEQR